MDAEINIAGRILVASECPGEKEISYGGCTFVLSGSSPIKVLLRGGAGMNVPESLLADFCLKISVQFHGKVFVWKTCEEYGNANVFNGGSDYEVVNETCFLSVCDNGKEIVRDFTDHWNEKIDAVI